MDIGAGAFHSIDQSIATGVTRPVALDSEHYDSGMHHLTINNQRMTAQAAGYYYVCGQVLWEDWGAVGRMILSLRKNNTTYLSSANLDARAGKDQYQRASTILHLGIGEWVDMTAYHTKGSNADIIAVSTDSPELQITILDNPGAKVYRNSTQSIPHGAWTVLNFNQEKWDTDGCHDNAVNNSRLTCQTEGYYVITFNGAFSGNVSGFRGFRFRLNGATPLGGIKYDATASGNSESLDTVYFLSVGDYVEVQAYNFHGAVPQSVLYLSEWTPYFAMHRIADQP